MPHVRNGVNSLSPFKRIRRYPRKKNKPRLWKATRGSTPRCVRFSARNNTPNSGSFVAATLGPATKTRKAVRNKVVDSNKVVRRAVRNKVVASNKVVRRAVRNKAVRNRKTGNFRQFFWSLSDSDRAAFIEIENDTASYVD